MKPIIFVSLILLAVGCEQATEPTLEVQPPRGFSGEWLMVVISETGIPSLHNLSVRQFGDKIIAQTQSLDTNSVVVYYSGVQIGNTISLSGGDYPIYVYLAASIDSTTDILVGTLRFRWVIYPDWHNEAKFTASRWH